MVQRAKSWRRSILVLGVLLGLTSCASAPRQLTQVEVREVPVAVRTPLPDECFKTYLPVSPFTDDGPLLLRTLDVWVQNLVQTVQQFYVQTVRCGELNQQRK